MHQIKHLNLGQEIGLTHVECITPIVKFNLKVNVKVKFI